RRVLFRSIQIAATGFTDAESAQANLELFAIPVLEDIEGVNTAVIVGGIGQRITIVPDAAKLAAAGLDSRAIATALQQSGILFPGGAITEGDSTLTVQTGERLSSVFEVAQLPLVGGQTPGIQIRDVAEVNLEADPITSFSRVNGEDAISISITKLPSANTVEVSQGVIAALDEI